MDEPGSIHCVLVSNHEGYLLFERWYAPGADDTSRAEWRSALREASSENIRQFAGQVASKDKSDAKDADDTFVALHRGHHVLYCCVSDIVVYIVGTGEYDELGLLEVMRGLMQCLRGVCRKAPSEALLGEHFGEVCLMVDEIINDGVLESTDWEVVRRGMKLKAVA